MRKIIAILILSRGLIVLLPLIFLASKNPSWIHWDAPHYIFIAKNWYASTGDQANFIVFPPLFPIFIKFIPPLIFSNIIFILGGALFYKIVAVYFRKDIAFWSTIFLCIFPTSYFFSAPYSESLFLLLSAGVFHFLRQKKWYAASVIAALAMLTRHIGLVLIIPILYEFWKSKNKRWFDLTAIFLPFAVAAASYLIINYTALGDPLAFQTILQQHWQKSFAPPWQALINSWKNTFVWPATEYSSIVGLWEALPATLSLLLIPSAYKYLKTSWAHYYTLYVVFILSTSFLLSTPRYLLVNLPLFVILAKVFEKHKLSKMVWLLLSTCLLSYFTNLYLTGRWAF